MYITKEEILNKVSEKDIFEKYVGSSVELGVRYHSPLRVDNNPTCEFKISSNGTLYFKDYSGHFMGGCFDFVMKMFGISFIEAVRLVAGDFGLSGRKHGYEQEDLTRYVAKTTAKVVKKEYQYVVNDWNDNNVAFWRDNFNVTIDVLNFFQVRPLKELWKDGLRTYYWRNEDPGFIYYFGPKDYKLYFPNRSEYKFLSQAKKVQGWNQLPDKGKLLIITKSMKDVIVLKMMGFTAIAPQSESTPIPETELKSIKSRFTHIHTLYDFDLTGVMFANRLKKEEGFKPHFFTNGILGSIDYKHKDLSDIVKDMTSHKRDIMYPAMRDKVNMILSYDTRKNDAQKHIKERVILEEIKSHILIGYFI